jgi:hypothetical protein
LVYLIPANALYSLRRLMAKLTLCLFCSPTSDVNNFQETAVKFVFYIQFRANINVYVCHLCNERYCCKYKNDRDMLYYICSDDVNKLYDNTKSLKISKG